MMNVKSTVLIKEGKHRGKMENCKHYVSVSIKF